MYRHGNPLASKNPIQIPIRINADPKSGCKSVSANGITTIINEFIILENRAIIMCLRAKYWAYTTINATFASSTG
jgi:hypothetical protein